RPHALAVRPGTGVLAAVPLPHLRPPRDRAILQPARRLERRGSVGRPRWTARRARDRNGDRRRLEPRRGGDRAVSRGPRRTGSRAKTGVPALLWVGGRESRSTIAGAREWASWIPGAEFLVLAGAHHAAPREAAPAWNAAVQGFLDRHGLGGQSRR